MTRPNIERQAAALRIVAFGLIGVIVLVNGVDALAPALPGLQFRAPADYAGIPPLVGRGLRLVAAIAWCLSFWSLARALEGPRRGEYFSLAVTKNLRRFAGFLVVALAVPALLAPIARSLLADCAGVETCSRAFLLDLRGMLLLVVATLLFLVIRLLDEARRLDDENRQII